MQVFRNSPAQTGGLKKYDFVTEIGGQKVEKADDAHVIIDRAMIGEVRVMHRVHFVC
jgi:S1-C subfamily serine protease